ncbi:hypothetical protein EG329_000242 [Mollisiaceae sp. DMI_Dod_QoI]|nr:hypothetical protein EG329_000242 [Helotiales sp. DMI_Dod_QoI]
MALTLLKVVVSLAIAIVLWPLATLTQNYLRVRHVGLPILFSPFGRLNPLWIITQPYLTPLFTWLSTLGGPFAVFNFIHYSTNSWFFFSRYTLHSRYGPAFFIVSPGAVQLIIADAATADEVQTRRKDFLKNPAMYKPLEILGPNVVTLNGDSWARHRRLTTPPFNERNSMLVWRESLVQADAMLKLWVSNGKGSLGGVENTPNDTMALALNVLMAAGFGKRYDYEGGAQGKKDGDPMSSYRDALRIVLCNLYRAIMTSMLMGLPSWAMPKKILEMKLALKEVGDYISAMMERDRAGLSEKGIEGDNLMSVLLKASESEAMGKGRSGLSDEEIIGNLFIYNVAGHDTTANTLAYAVTLLATDPGLQDWLREEINSEFGGEESAQKWDYEKAFPQLKRCLAVMLETLRLYGPVFFIPRYTAESFQRLTIQGKEYILPPHTQTLLNTAGLHTLPSYWGTDSLVWRPGRWLDENGELIQPPPGMYNPWTAGPRVCPGKKFSQVEFVAVIAKLFQKGKVRPKLEAGEKQEQAFNRAKSVVANSILDVTLHMALDKVRNQFNYTNQLLILIAAMGSEYTSERVLRSIEIKTSAGVFTYNAWDKFECFGHSYTKGVADFIPLLEPLKTKAGLIAKRQPPKPRTQLATWWQAQCIFRGLDSKGTVPQLQQALRGHEVDPVSDDILLLLRNAKEEYRVKNDEALENNWLHKLSDAEKAEKDPKRYLAETFKKGKKSKDIVVWKTERAIEDSSEDEDNGNYIVVVGQSKSAVAEKIRSLDRQAQRIKRERQEAKNELKRKRQKEIEAALSKSRDWDVTGTWKISCPHIEKGWDAENLTLEIYRGDSQMWAKFDFGAITGVFRFERHNEDDAPPPSKPSRKNPDEDSDQEKDSDEEVGEDEDEDSRSETPGDFYLGKISQPSQKYPTWQYRYRGEEQGEGEIELGSDDDLYSITFLGPKGRTLEGDFGSGAFGACEFTGVKVAIGTEPDTDIAYEWGSRNEEAYESARVGRWH